MPPTVRRLGISGKGRGRGGYVFGQKAVTVAVPSATGAENDLQSVTLEGNTLYRNKSSIRIRAIGTTAANANSKQAKVLFGGTTVWDSGAVAANAKPWSVVVDIWRTASGAQIAMAVGNFNGVAVTPQRTALTKDDTQDQIIKTTGIANTTAGDLTSEFLLVEACPDVP